MQYCRFRTDAAKHEAVDVHVRPGSREHPRLLHGAIAGRGLQAGRAGAQTAGGPAASGTHKRPHEEQRPSTAQQSNHSTTPGHEAQSTNRIDIGYPKVYIIISLIMDILEVI